MAPVQLSDMNKPAGESTEHRLLIMTAVAALCIPQTMSYPIPMAN